MLALLHDGYGGAVKRLDRRQMLVWLGGVGLALLGASNEAVSQGKSGGKGKGGRNEGNSGNSGNSDNAGNPGNSSKARASSPSAAPDAADGVLDQDAALDAVKHGEALPLRTLLPEIERRYRGDVIDAVLRKKGRKLVYTLKVLSPEGRVFVVAVDAATGRQERGFFQSFGF
jgi:hypothetical protein